MGENKTLFCYVGFAETEEGRCVSLFSRTGRSEMSRKPMVPSVVALESFKFGALEKRVIWRVTLLAT